MDEESGSRRCALLTFALPSSHHAHTLLLTLLALSITAFAQQTTTPTAKPAQRGFHEPNPFDFDNHTGFKQIFDGKTLTGWDGDPAIWRVEDGAIVGESDSLTVRPPNTYISYH